MIKTPRQILKSKGYDDDCTPNYLSEIEAVMNQHTKPYKDALKLIKAAFPADVLSDQMGEDYHKIEDVLKSLK